MTVTALPREPMEMDEDFLDCTGKKRTFRLAPHPNGQFLEATEQGGEAAGRRFLLPIPAGGPAPWGELRTKIRERLAQRDVVRDEEGRIEVLNNLIRAQISCRDGEPTLLVDDMELTWEEVGSILVTYEGWGLRMEIRGCGEE